MSEPTDGLPRFRKTCEHASEPVREQHVLNTDNFVAVQAGQWVCPDCLAPCHELYYFSDASFGEWPSTEE